MKTQKAVKEVKNLLDDSELTAAEYHPSASSALSWFNEWKYANVQRYVVMRESVASTALSGNRLAQVLNGTLNRLQSGQPVSDRYLLGLCWFLRFDYEKNTK